MEMRGALMEDRSLPIFFESRWSETNHQFGKIVGIQPRTRCTRSCSVEWADGTKAVYKGAASRPWWIEHIFKNKTDWLIAKATAERKAKETKS